ncbi:MAG TPA: rhomboid family intramembrane serine protease [Xylella sp.]
MITLILIVMNALVFWLTSNNSRLRDRFMLWPPAVDRDHQYDRLITYGFVHADISHLVFNMVTLYFFGRMIEGVMWGLTGSLLTYLFFYLGALLVSILPSYIKHRKDPQYLSLGASGAVSAVLFASVLLQPWALIVVVFIPMPAILYAVFYVGYSIWMERRGDDGVNHSAHLSGAAFGVLFMLCMEPRLLEVFLMELSMSRFG